ncbi:MAG: DUF883 domain-containing protein [Rubrivivax sp.]|nr:MAG: DUF883 domain-containing protein [Rubrivivax sp.]
MATDNVQLKQDLENVLHEVQTLLHNVGDQSTEKALALRSRVNQALAAAQTRLVGIGVDARDRAKQAAVVTDEYVHEKPWQAIGIGAAVGVLVGVLAARR